MRKKNAFELLFDKSLLHVATVLMMLGALGATFTLFKIYLSGKEIPSGYEDYFVLMAASLLFNLFFTIMTFLYITNCLGRDLFEKKKAESGQEQKEYDE